MAGPSLRQDDPTQRAAFPPHSVDPPQRFCECAAILDQPAGGFTPIVAVLTGEMFLAYVEQCLAPTLRRDDIVVMDNCRVHMAPAVREAIEKAKASLRVSSEILA